jgi:hypothetical protein
MQRQWLVRLRGEGHTRHVTGERVEVAPDFVTFVDEAGEVVLLVARDHLLSVEPGLSSATVPPRGYDPSRPYTRTAVS